ncbi:50S ribosomal protein L2 [Nymphaea thermarum]|nr:50S ribosomal protein L2 [Nymphaea thermarum]
MDAQEGPLSADASLLSVAGCTTPSPPSSIALQIFGTSASISNSSYYAGQTAGHQRNAGWTLGGNEPQRLSLLGQFFVRDGQKRYILHPKGAINGDTIVFGTKVSISMGNDPILSVV